jgi:2-isopropylmalate synthase
MIRDTIEYLRASGRRVIYDAEHWFDGYKHNRDYALQTLEAAATAGAEWLVLCDTNGGTLPHEVSQIVQDVVKRTRGWGLGTRESEEGNLKKAKGERERGKELLPMSNAQFPIPNSQSLVPIPQSPVPQIGIHTHNDSDTAVANALAAVMAGARDGARYN